MRNYILLDEKISDAAYLKWVTAHQAYIEDTIGIRPQYIMTRRDYTTFPSFVDSDGDVSPSKDYRAQEYNDMVEKYGKYSHDHIFMFVHEDNWKADRIWGTSWSNSPSGIHFEYCKWQDKFVNTLWTSIHEGTGHPLDSLCKVETGVDLNKKAEAWLRYKYINNSEAINYLNTNGFDWDRDFVHGKFPTLHYIGHKNGYPYTESTELLKAMAPYIKAAYKKRLQLHVDDLKNKLSLLQRILLLKRKVAELLNRKNGVRT